MRVINLCLVATFLCLRSVSVASKDEWNTVGQLSYNVLKEENLDAHGTKIFRRQPGLHVRHDLEIHVALQLREHCDEPFEFKLIENKTSTISTWSQGPVIQEGESHFYFHINQSILVGKYGLNISDPCSKEVLAKTVHLCDVNVMFNPWPVQQGNERVRRQTVDTAFTNEYLYNNYGYLWLWQRGIIWNYAVGGAVVAESYNRMLGLMTVQERSSYVLYSRALTRVIGQNVLFGRWDGMYSDGVEPTQWVGSEEILGRWLENGQKVRYAQCWVYAAILTTMLRASGIHARPVTNYGSHHDRGLSNDRLSVLRQYDNIVQTDEDQWNFHVWTEAWLERSDLGTSLLDWSAVDATPQEPSPLNPGQSFQSGPAFVPNIRANNRVANYDTLFILAEVNARRICPITGQPLPSNNIGYAVVTKLPGMDMTVYNYNNPDYITNSYKIVTSSKRDADSDSLPPPYEACEREGGLRLNITPPIPQVGEDFVITVTEGNVTVEDIVIRMELRNYMGESLGFIRNYTGTRQINVAEVDYSPYLGNSNIFRFTVGQNDQSGAFEFHNALRTILKYRPVQVEATKIANSNNISVMLTYTNPLSVAMTGVMVNVAGPNETYMMIPQPDISANGLFITTLSVPCGDNIDTEVMIPVSVDSSVTQSTYGIGLSSCSVGSPNSGTVLFEMSILLVMFLFSLCILIY